MRELSGRSVDVRAVREVGPRRIVLEQRVERRVIETVIVAAHATVDPPRDLRAELWSLVVERPAGERGSVVVEDTRTASVRPCPDCDGATKLSCKRCGGLCSLVCSACGGSGSSSHFSKSRIACGTCGGDGRVPCFECSGGTTPCTNCDAKGSAFTEQRARVTWERREVTSLLGALPHGVEAPAGRAAIEDEYALEDGVLRSVRARVEEHFRAAAFGPAPEVATAIATLVQQHPPASSERLEAQRARVERITVWAVDCAVDGGSITVYLVGDELRPVGLDQLPSGPGPAVAVVVLALGTLAILAGSVLK